MVNIISVLNSISIICFLLSLLYLPGGQKCRLHNLFLLEVTTVFLLILSTFSSQVNLLSLMFLSFMCMFLAAGVPIENILYLGGPNIASEIYNKEYANARICGAEKWRKPLAKFLRHPHFIVWDNSDLVTHEVMGGLKNVYAIGAGKYLCVFWPIKFV